MSAERMNLFGNHAPPQLREFYSPSPRLLYNPNAPWFGQFRRLMLYGPLSLQNLFVAPANTPLLEFLAIKGHTFSSQDSDHTPFPSTSGKISLPHLVIICLQHKFMPCLLILVAIIPSSSCDLHLSIAEDDFSPEDIDAFRNALIQYTQLYTVGTVTQLTLQVTIDSFDLFVQETSGFRLMIDVCTIWERWIDLCSSLIHMLTTFELSAVNEFSSFYTMVSMEIDL
ncbi:hypothetical protein CPB84DRAFT_1764890, partial [Gymnopilus junonius]